MSQADVDRFVADLKTNSALLDELKGETTGLAAVVDFAKGKGYDISVAEAKAYIGEQAKQDLSDEQLDALAGGKGHHSVSTVTAVVTAQTAAAATTEAVAAETTEAVAAETTAGAAAEVGVVAVAVIVLT